MEIMLQLRFVFVGHFKVFFITSQLRYLFVRYSNVFLTLELRYILVRSNNVTLQLRLFFVRYCDVFFMTLQLRYLFVRCFNDVRITFYFGTFEVRTEITL